MKYQYQKGEKPVRTDKHEYGSIEWVIERTIVYQSNLLYFDEKFIATVYTDEEADEVVAAISESKLNPQKWGADNGVDATHNVKKYYSNRKRFKESYYSIIQKRIDSSEKLTYNNKSECGFVALEESKDDELFDMSMREILNIVAELFKGKSVEYIISTYEFHYDGTNWTDNIKLIKYAYESGKLDETISKVCYISQQDGGYIDYPYSDEPIRNLHQEYLLHSAKK